MQKSFSTQSALFVSPADLEHPILHSLDDTEALLDWSEIEALLSSIYSAKTGRPSYPLLTLFRSLLLGVWYQLSDVQLAQALYRDLLFRKFCRLELGGDVPEASTLGRFRARLVEHDLWEALLANINRQLEKKNIIMTQGRINIIDATPIEAAQSGPGNGKNGQPKKDPEAGWHVKQDSRGRKKSTYGFSVHTAVDEDGFIQRQSITAGNVHDSQERDALILGDETALYADAAYSSKETRDTLARLGIDDQVQRKADRNKPLSKEDHHRNKCIAVTRSTSERPFATYKWHYGLARTRFMGLAKNATVYGLAAMAANLRKGAKFLTEYGLPEPSYTG
jgi:IS5 family transposase